MKLRLLPGTDLRLSVIGMGCWAIGGEHWGDDVDDADSIAAVHAALDAGITWFDTAPLYGWGRADRVLAEALDNEAGRRAVIATKVGVRRGADGHAESFLGARFVRADVEASLERLGRDTLDLVQVHWPCQHATPFEETFGALASLKKAGKIRHYGVCNYNARTLPLLPEGVASLQTPYSLVRREFELELRKVTQQLGTGVLAYETLCRGLLSGKYRRLPTFPESDMRRRDDRFQGGRFLAISRLVEDLRKAARRLKLPLPALAVGWVAGQPGVTAALVGAKRPDQIRQTAQGARLVGHDKALDVIGRIAAHHGPI